MARPLRMEVPGGRFHITARGDERKIIYRDDRDRVHFLSLLGELTGRYGTLLHGYMERSLSWEQIVQAVERGKGERWEQFCRRHGDWGRDAALWLGRHAGRMRLGQLAQQVGCDYTTVGKAVSRFGQRLRREKELAIWLKQLKKESPNVKFEI